MDLLDVLTGHALTMMIRIGHRTGLFEALAREPATSAELAERAGLHERYVREWLGAVTTGGLVDHDAGRYSLPSDRAAALAAVGASAGMLGVLDTVLPQVLEGFTTGAGVPYSAYAQVAGSGLGETWRRVYDEQLVDGFVAAVPGLTERLAGGARVLDLGCGTGHAVAVLAAAFPASTFLGVDIAPEAIALAGPALPNAAYEVADAAELDGVYDVVFAFDAIHDQRVPDVVLRRVREALSPAACSSWSTPGSPATSRRTWATRTPRWPTPRACCSACRSRCTRAAPRSARCGAPSWRSGCCTRPGSATSSCSTHRARRTASSFAGPEVDPWSGP